MGSSALQTGHFGDGLVFLRCCDGTPGSSTEPCRRGIGFGFEFAGLALAAGGRGLGAGIGFGLNFGLGMAARASESPAPWSLHIWLPARANFDYGKLEGQANRLSFTSELR